MDIQKFDTPELRKKRLEDPLFLIVIASETDYKIIQRVPISTLVENDVVDEFESELNRTIKDGSLSLGDGEYVGYVVRKTMYDSNIIDIKDINVRNGYITSKQITVIDGLLTVK